MIGNSGLRRSRRGRRSRRQSESDPMAGVANLADVMLVFACGLMIAIVMFWNVDLSKVVDVFDESDLKEVENPDELLQDDSSANQFEDKGRVIQDPETGQMYVIED